ncbi:MAG: hypothetical protein ABIQ04_02550 [Candidatus Saccharimonadales bacterium]
MSVETFSLKTPSLSASERGLFEHLYSDPEAALTLATLALGATVRNIQSYYKRTESSDISTTTNLFPEITKQLEEAIETAQHQPSTTLVDLFRARTQLTFLDQTILGPLLFRRHGDYAARRQLNNGVYGLSMGLIEDALLIADTPDIDDLGSNEIRGVLNEQTALALLNRTQNCNKLAVPASTSADFLLKTDINYLYIPNDRKTYVSNIQVKSSDKYNLDQEAPKNGFVVSGIDLGNFNNNFRAARLILRELNGTATTKDSVNLDAIHGNFMEIVAERLRTYPGAIAA